MKYIFLLKENKIKSFRMREDKFESVKFQGEEKQDYNERYWNNWSTKEGIEKDKKNDFCIISDEDIDIPSEKFTFGEKSDFTPQDIKKFLKEKLKKESNINLVWNEESKIYKLNDQLNIRIYPATKFEDEKIKQVSKERAMKTEVTINDGDSDLARHFKSETQKIKNL